MISGLKSKLLALQKKIPEDFRIAFEENRNFKKESEILRSKNEALKRVIESQREAPQAFSREQRDEMGLLSYQKEKNSRDFGLKERNTQENHSPAKNNRGQNEGSNKKVNEIVQGLESRISRLMDSNHNLHELMSQNDHQKRKLGSHEEFLMSFVSENNIFKENEKEWDSNEKNLGFLSPDQSNNGREYPKGKSEQIERNNRKSERMKEREELDGRVGNQNQKMKRHRDTPPMTKAIKTFDSSDKKGGEFKEERHLTPERGPHSLTAGGILRNLTPLSQKVGLYKG